MSHGLWGHVEFIRMHHETFIEGMKSLFGKKSLAVCHRNEQNKSCMSVLLIFGNPHQ